MKNNKILGNIFLFLGATIQILLIFFIVKIIISNFRVVLDFKELVILFIIGTMFYSLSSIINIRKVNNKLNKRKNVRKTIIYIFILYLTVLIIALFFKLGMGRFYETDNYLEYIKNNFNLKPLSIIKYYINGFATNSINPSTIFYNLLGNVILFMPVGVFLYILFIRMREFKLYFLIMSMIIILVEVLQLLTTAGFMDIDDYILNIVGSVLSFGIMKNKYVNIILEKYYILGDINEI